MKSELYVRETLISNTIQLIAEGGFAAATTKAITHSGNTSPDIKMNEAYIYRLFGNKEQLYDVAFERLDLEFIRVLRSCNADYGTLHTDTSVKFYKAFLRIWQFLLHNETRCRCYVRYYYSVYFKGKPYERHQERFKEIVSAFAPLFKEEADVKAILHSVLISLLDFAIRVYNGDMKNLELDTPHVFNVLYYMMLPYFLDETNTAIDLKKLSKEGNDNAQAG